MNVWMINHYAKGPDRPGGTRHYSLGRELVALGHDVTVLASSFDHKTRRETRSHRGRGPAHDTIDDVRFVWLKTPPYTSNGPARAWNMTMFGYRAWVDGRRRRPEPDVVVGSSPHPFAAMSADQLARHFGVPFVYEVRDLWPQSLVDVGSVSSRHPLVLTFGAIERRLYRHATRVVTLLPAAEEYIVAHGGRQDAIRWIPNGADIRSIGPVRPPREGPKFVVIYAGAHGEANALDTILDAARIVVADESTKVEFRFIGDGPERARLIERAQSFGLDNVVFRQAVPKSAIPELLAEAHAFVLTLRGASVFRYGVSPNKLFDYMGAGRPVIFACNTPRDPVAEAGGGLSVRAEDPAQLAQAVRRLAQMSMADRHAMGERGRSYVEANFDMAVLAKRYETVLQEAVEDSGRLAAARGANASG
jgi:glycosyltransferase involved in cell wall biosynthesis